MAALLSVPGFFSSALMWPGMDDDDKKSLLVANLGDFRARLKSSFGVTATLEVAARDCVVCCSPMAQPAMLARKCLKSAHPCAGAACTCADRTQVCLDCLTQILWTSPRSQPKLGRFRASCPMCHGEFCHFDVVCVTRAVAAAAVVVVVPPPMDRPLQTAHRMARVCVAAERRRILEWCQGRLAPAPDPTDTSVEATIRRFAATEDARELPLEGLSAAQRAVAHKVAEELRLEHVSHGEGAKRCLMVRKPPRDPVAAADGALEDDLVWKGYFSLQGPSVEAAAGEHVARVAADWRMRRERRDGTEHHITIVSRAELEELAGRGKGKLDKKVASALLWSFRDGVEDDWKALGLGRVEDAESVAMFVVVDWPAANAWRRQQGLADATFHITLGFSKHDIHHVRKDRTTLL